MLLRLSSYLGTIPLLLWTRKSMPFSIDRRCFCLIAINLSELSGRPLRVFHATLFLFFPSLAQIYGILPAPFISMNIPAFDKNLNSKPTFMSPYRQILLFRCLTNPDLDLSFVLQIGRCTMLPITRSESHSMSNPEDNRSRPCVRGFGWSSSCPRYTHPWCD